MISITPDVYRKVAEKLLSEISDKEYYTGSFEIPFPEHDFRARMTVSLITYRNSGNIHDIISVWWEFHTYITVLNQLDEVVNDFKFSELREIIRESRYEES